MGFPLSAKFNSCDMLQFVQGDETEVDVVIYSPKTAEPKDLTGAVISLNLPRQGGGSIKRTNGPITIPYAAIVPAVAGTPGSVHLPDHGLCTGDKVQLTVLAGGTLPVPLVAATDYLILVIDNDNFYFTDTSAAIVSLTTQGTIGFTMLDATDLVLGTTPLLGQCTLNLRALVSAVANAALAQTFQISVKDSSNETTIILIQNLLDIYPQPVP